MAGCEREVAHHPAGGALVVPRVAQVAGQDESENSALWKHTGIAQNQLTSAKAAIHMFTWFPLPLSNSKEVI